MREQEGTVDKKNGGGLTSRWIHLEDDACSTPGQLVEDGALGPASDVPTPVHDGLTEEFGTADLVAARTPLASVR